MRRNKYLFLAISLLTWLMGSSSVMAQHEHDFQNGICSYTDCPSKFEEPQMAEDGYYELRNAGNVEWIGQLIINGKLDPYCRLMNDIDFMGIENLHSPLGPDNGKKYNGVFDGQGFRIKNMIINRPNSERQGFFGALRGNPNTHGEATVIKNLIIDKSCSIIGGKRTGGVCGAGQNNEKEIYILNCVNEASVTSSTNNVAGILGGSDSSHPKWQIMNCVNTGTITCTNASHEGAGITSWCGDNAATRIENCINIGYVEGIDGSGRAIFRHSGSLTAKNNYDLSESGGTQGIDHDFMEEDLLNGKLCYYMNGNQENIIYWQTIGLDAYPTPISGKSKQVYFAGNISCDGETLPGGEYTNEDKGSIRADHEFVEGDYYCQVCGQINPNYCEQIDGVYQLNNVEDVMWFAEFVKGGAQTANALLTCDLDFTDIDFEGIGTRDMGYKGTFDGGFHTISNMDMSWRSDEEWVGFINFLNGGATVKNLRGDATCFIAARGNAGFIGGSALSGDIHITNVGYEGDVTVTNAGAGGVIGCNTGSAAKVYMDNCYSTGFITGNGIKENGALSAWLGSNGPVVTNCWSSATVNLYENDEKYLFRHGSGTATNCYTTIGTQGSLFEYEELENGSLCYKLNGDQSNITWYQNIGSDELPTFMPGHKQVYIAIELNCDGSYNPEEATFTNVEGETSQKPHVFVDGFCKNCNHEDEEYDFIRIIENPDHDITTGYTVVRDGGNHQIANSVAEFWDSKSFNAYQPITGLKQGIYKLRVQGLQRVCRWDNNGREYEDGRLNEEFAPLYHSSQYFAEVNGKKVANLFMDIASQAQEERVNETEDETNEGLWVPNSMAACRKYFAKGLYWNAPIYFYVGSEDDVVNIGVENGTYLSGNWTVWDTWRLEYVGDAEENMNLIRQQQINNIQNLSELEAQAILMDSYADAQEQIENATTLEELLEATNVLSTTPMLIRKSHFAYQAYDKAMQDLIEEVSQRDGLNSEAAQLLKEYLGEASDPSDELPNGSYITIMEEKNLTDAELAAEITFAQDLFSLAVKTSISEGSDISNLIINADFTKDGNFANWTTEIIKASSNGSNFSSNSGFTDIYPVAGTWNTAFDVHQDLEEGLPNGIYELEAPAFYRPGGNGQGDLDGNDYVPASLYINNFYTPVMNIYKGQILKDDAINGVNCRYDSQNDPEAPHNGEATSAQDYDTGEGYVPEQRQAVSFAFAGGRYINHAYAIVTDNKLRVGIRNTGNPWYESGMTMWGKFKLVYRGKDTDAIDAMMENYNAHLESLKYNQEIGNVLFSMSHIDKIEELMGNVEAAGSADEKMAALQELNEEFNTVRESQAIYDKLYTLYEWCYNEADKYVETNPDLMDAFYAIGDEVQDHVYSGDLTDEEALNFYDSIQDRPEIGGGVYVQGDLVDAEGNNVNYNDITTLYPLTKNAEGKYVGTFKLQNRANMPNNSSRSGFYFTRLENKIGAASSARRFVTPKNGKFDVAISGEDFQATSGEFKVVLDLKNNTIELEAIDYTWNDNVFVVGSIIDDEGNQHRWKNDEMCPLEHKGNGVYEGDVTFFKDPNHLNDGDFLTFTIFGCRATTGLHEYTKNATRANWNEARYGSEVNAIHISDGEVVSDLIRNSDRQWWMVWDNENDTQSYHITFDMNANTVSITKNLDDEDAINSVVITEDNNGFNSIYNLAGQRVSKPVKGLYIVNGKKVAVK